MRDALGGVQSVVVLGGTSEIAEATVRELIDGRCRSVVLAGRDINALQAVAQRHRAYGATTVGVVPFDATAPATHSDVFDDIARTYGEIDVVIVAFGVLGDQAVLDADPAAGATLVAVNLGGAVSAITAAATLLRSQGHGTIIVISSVAGLRVRSDNVTYGATKAGLDGFAQGMSDRLHGSGVNLMIVRPGFVRTKMTAGLPDAPFPTTPERVGADIAAGLARGRAVVWSPGVLRLLFTVLRILPRPLWRMVSAR